MATTLKTFDPATPTAEIGAMLLQDGGAIIRNMVPESLMDEVYSEIMTNARSADLESNTPLWPQGNKTLGGLPSISPLTA